MEWVVYCYRVIGLGLVLRLKSISRGCCTESFSPMKDEKQVCQRIVGFGQGLGEALRFGCAGVRVDFGVGD